jgi:hypothetical protein
LLAYLQAAAGWMKALLSTDREPLLRPERDLPFFSKDEFREFPYKHTALWADSEYGAMNRLVETFQMICAKVSRANLAFIRNGLDHQRDEQSFPKVNEMLAFVAHFREALDNADMQRFYPKELWLESLQIDRNNRSERILCDYLGRRQALSGPTFVHRFGPQVGAKYPRIVAPGNILGYANSEIISSIREASAYTQYWDGYPRRREIPNPNRSPDEASSKSSVEIDSELPSTSFPESLRASGGNASTI